MLTRILHRLRTISPLAWGVLGGFLFLCIAIGALAWYGERQFTSLSAQVEKLNNELSSTTLALQENIATATSSLGSALALQQQDVATVADRVGAIAQDVGSISGSVTTLEKLTTTDPELLAKYSKVFFLSENYAPARLVTIPPAETYYEDKTMQIIPGVLPKLENMLRDASSTGVTLYVDSAYRSFGTQAALKNEYTVTYGAGTANQFSADQGYSEHQLGTTVDLITPGLGGSLTNAFANTPAYTWLANNAYRYGFVLSYPKGNSYYIYEPWHWRYVGVRLATDLHNQGKYFYDLDQRTIDSYLVYFYD